MIRDDAATDGKRDAGDVGAGRVDAAAATETPSDDSGPREHGGHDLGIPGTDPAAATPGGEAGGGKFAPSGPAVDSQAPPAPADVVNVRENTEGGGAGGTGGTDAARRRERNAKIKQVLRDLGYVPAGDGPGICVACGPAPVMHPFACPGCGARVCVEDECIEAHSIACLVATFKAAYSVDLPKTCHHCGRVATLDAMIQFSEQAERVVRIFPIDGELVGHLCVLFCPAPACKEESRRWYQRWPIVPRKAPF